MTSKEALRILYNCDECQVMVFGGIFVSIWYLAPTVDSLTELGRVQDEWLEEKRPLVAAVSVVLPSVGMTMRQEAREAAADVRRKNAERITGSCTVIEGDGFWASIVRSALGAIEFLGGGGTVTSKVTRTLEQGLAWAAGTINEDAAFVAAAHEAVQAARR